MESCLKMSKSLIYLGVKNGKHLMYQDGVGRDFFLGELEYKYLCSLDGNKNDDELLQIFTSLTEDDIQALNKTLCSKGLIEGYELQREKSISEIVVFSKYKGNFHEMKKITKTIVESLFWITWIAFPALIVYLIKDVDFKLLFSWLIDLNFWKVAYYISIVILSVYMHEKGHAIMSVAKNAVVVKYNYGFMSFMPCVSTVISGLSMLNKASRIKVCMSGFVSNLWLCLCSLSLNSIFESCYLQFVAVFNLCVILFNLIIFFKSDGWQVLNILFNFKAPKTNAVSRFVSFDLSLNIMRIALCVVIVILNFI